MKHVSRWWQAPVWVTAALLCGVARAPAATNEVVKRSFAWEVKAGSGLVYVLGSIHLGREDLYPLAPAVNMQPGDLFVLLTDGFYEWARQDREMFGIDRAVALIKQEKNLRVNQGYSRTERETHTGLCHRDHPDRRGTTRDQIPLGTGTFPCALWVP